jgi:hypothetical protein
MIGYNELGRLWEEEMLTLFKVLSCLFPGGNDEDQEKILGWSVSWQGFLTGAQQLQVRSVTACLVSSLIDIH